MLLLSIFFALGFESKWEINDTDIYQTLTPTRVAISPKKIFILNAREQEIISYSKSGLQRRVVAGKGEGPGELNQVNRITFQENRLYAVSPHKIQYFDNEGKYIGQLVRKRRIGGMFKSARGWVNAPFMYTPEHAQVFLYNDDLTQKKLLLSWQANPQVKEINGKKMRTYGVFSQFAISRDKSRLYSWLSDQPDMIKVFDLITEQATAPIQLSITNGDYDPSLMKIPNANPIKLENQDLIQELGIEHFGFLATTPDKKIYWFPSRNQTRALVVDDTGTQHQAEFTAHELERIVGQDSDHFFITFVTVDEELGIAKVHRNRVKSFLNQQHKDPYLQ